MPSTSVLLIVAVLVVTALLLRPNRYAKLPPGPPGLPVLGNLLEMPSSFLHLKLHEWSKQYGPMFSFNAAGQRVVVVNSAKAAGDVLDRLSAVSSGRPAWIKVNQFLSRYNNMVATQHGETWRRLRKATHEVLNIRTVNGFREMQEEEAIILVKGLIHHPELDLVKHFHRTSASIVWRALYGGPALSLDGEDPSERVEELAAYIFKASLPGTSLVDTFPLLRHVYAASKWARSNLDKWFEEATGIYTELYDSAKDASALATPCVSNSLSKLGEQYGVSETMSAWTGGVLFTAGQDTTATTLRYFALSMLLYPDALRAAHAQLDEVVGDRPPTFADRDQLPYVWAIIKEVNRWRPSVPAGVPHGASEDFEYKGYVIPKGTWLIDNIWSQGRDEALYSDPETFNPSRFLDEKGQLKPGGPDSHDDWLTFGHGRRICPGRDLALNSLFISFAYLLWAFDFRKAKDASGQEITPSDMDLVDNFLTVQPAPFKINLVPRFPDLESKLT